MVIATDIATFCRDVTQTQELLVMLVFFASRSLKVSQVMEVINMAVLEKNPFAQHLIDMGVEKGIEKGQQQAKQALASKLSESDHTTEQIAALLEVSEDQIKAWLSANPALGG